MGRQAQCLLVLHGLQERLTSDVIMDVDAGKSFVLAFGDLIANNTMI